jgi:hypothetical protein
MTLWANNRRRSLPRDVARVLLKDTPAVSLRLDAGIARARVGLLFGRVVIATANREHEDRNEKSDDFHAPMVLPFHGLGTDWTLEQRNGVSVGERVSR